MCVVCQRCVSGRGKLESDITEAQTFPNSSDSLDRFYLTCCIEIREENVVPRLAYLSNRSTTGRYNSMKPHSPPQLHFSSSSLVRRTILIQFTKRVVEFASVSNDHLDNE